MSELQKHIQCKIGDVGEYVLIPGDPDRARKIAGKLNNPKQISSHREFVVFTGYLESTAVSVCSTGIGGASASIAIEELARIGAKYFIRVGSAGGRQENISIGSLAIATAAYRGEGTSRAYAPIAFPAVADINITNALIEACNKFEYQCYVGTVYTRDAYYMQDEELNKFLTAAGVIAAEQECATAFILGAIRHLHVGAILATDSNIWLQQQPSLREKQALFRKGEERAIAVSIEAMKILIAENKGAV